MISVREAREIISSVKLKASIKEVSFDALSGFVLAEDIYADRDYPPFNRATMDGFAVNSENFRGGMKFRIVAEIPAGFSYDKKINSDSCVKIMTGASVPEGLDVIIKLEDSEELPGMNDEKFASFHLESVKPFLNIAKKGEDIQDKAKLLQKGNFCSPQVVSALATLGITNVKVTAPPSVAIISTGNEIVSPESDPSRVQIRDSNSYTLCEFLKKYNIKPEITELVPDDPDRLRESIKRGLEKNILFITGGVSMGSHDFVPAVLKSLNVTNRFHKVGIKPGKPFWFGESRSGGVVFALPGNPFSVQIIYKVFIENFLRNHVGLSDTMSLILPMEISREKKNNLDEYFPASIVNHPGSAPFMKPIGHNGSGDIRAGLYSDGIGLHPASEPVLEKGSLSEFIYW
ncbi:MAG: molybdopterin molybdotransferase MoeA [Leptospira sp.]|nr:molybdopterin molybdotransferase MoeA [Leptospira sp.]